MRGMVPAGADLFPPRDIRAFNHLGFTVDATRSIPALRNPALGGRLLRELRVDASALGGTDRLHP